MDFWIELPGKPRQRVRKPSPVQTRRGAEEFERQLREEYLAAAPADAPPEERKEVTVREFSEEFLRSWAGIYNRPVEQEQKRRVLRKHLLPALGKLELREVDMRVVNAYARVKLDEGLHPTTVNQHLACLSKMLQAAVEWNVLERAPRLRKLETPPPSWDFLQPAESSRLLEAAGRHGPEDRVLVLTALRTGLRITELLALRWESVDLVAGTVRVTRSRSAKGAEVGPKTKRERVVDLSPALLEALKDHRHLRGPYVFCDRAGAAFTRDEANWVLVRAQRRAGLRTVSWRILRHSCASQLLMAGRSIKEVQEILGHTELGTTLRYAHLAPSAKRDAVSALDALEDSVGHHLVTHTGLCDQDRRERRAK